MTMRLIVVALLEHGQRHGEPTYVVTQRKADAHLGGSWELPGGGVEPGETPEEALLRELREELGVEVEPGSPRPLTFSHHRYPSREVLLLFYGARTAEHQDPRPLAAERLSLMTRDELLALPMPPANAPLRELLAASAAPGGASPLRARPSRS